MTKVDILQQVHDEVNQVEELLSSLNKKVMLDNSLSVVSNEQIKKIYRQFRLLDTSIYNHHKISVDSNDRLEHLTDVMSSIADLDFSQEARVENDEQFNHLDYIALSVNLMRDRLQDKFDQFILIKCVFNALDDLYIVTDKDDNILLVNQTLERHYQLKSDDVTGKSMAEFFQLDKIARYSIDFTRCLPTSMHYKNSHTIPENNDKDVISLRVENRYLPINEDFGSLYRIKPFRKETPGKAVKELALVSKYKQLISEYSDELHYLIQAAAKDIAQKDEIIAQIRSMYQDKSRLSLAETAILRSLEELDSNSDV